METIGFIGGGNMAEALIKGIVSAKIYRPEQIFVSDIKNERLKFLADTYKISTLSSNKELAKKVDIVILSVEPQQMAAVLEDIKNDFNKNALFIFIAAGKKISFFTSRLGSIKIIRVMPNTPALIGEGTCGIFAPQNAKDKLPKALSIFSSVGKTFVLENEELIDAVTATSGSGPAYFFLLMESMIKAASELGFDEDTATDIVIQTAKGAALLAEKAGKTGQTPARLRNKIVSRGGTTEAALKIFAEANFEQIVNAALKRAWQRAGELSK
jgi:pyrroline-5-carboxylate reductase